LGYVKYPSGDIYDEKGQFVSSDLGVSQGDLYGLMLFPSVTYVCWKLIQQSLENGLQPGYPLDILVINLSTQLFLCFTRKGWYIYFCIPAYVAYIVLGYIWRYVKTTNKFDPNAVVDEIDPKEVKRLAKKERKEAKGERVKYMK
jgi:hypothetical protein